MKNTIEAMPVLVFHAFVLMLAALCILVPLSYGESAKEKIADVDLKASGDSHLSANTMAPMLMTSLSGGGAPSVSLLSTVPFTMGTKGAVEYQKFGEKSYSIQYENSRGSVSFFLIFQYELDLRDRWVRVSYSGRYAPDKLYVAVDRQEGRSESEFPIFLEKSDDAHDSFFKLPNRSPFSNVTALDFVIPAEDQKTLIGKFLLLDIQIMPSSFDPLVKEQMKPVGIAPLPELFKADNRVEVK